MKHLLVFVLVSAAALSGCATVGRNFDSTSLDWIKSGQTTKMEVLAELGQPFRVGMDSGRRTWTYGYYRYRLFGASTAKDLVIRWNSDGKVEAYNLNTSFPEEKKAIEPALKQ